MSPSLNIPQYPMKPPDANILIAPIVGLNNSTLSTSRSVIFLRLSRLPNMILSLSTSTYAGPYNKPPTINVRYMASNMKKARSSRTVAMQPAKSRQYTTTVTAVAKRLYLILDFIK